VVPRAVALGAPLPRAFYERHPVVVARDVLGRVLVHDGADGRCAGRIVEVEAYRGALDPASHAFRGRTARNATMFGPAGHAYLYFIYGVHWCLNLVTEGEGRASAVLVRALEPLAGIERMRARRGVAEDRRLACGPGNLAAALGLARAHDGTDLTRGPLWVSDRPPDRAGRRVAVGPRIGITRAAGRPWRLWLAGHPCVSAERTARPARARGHLR
jgi:DNA-3-methyladenine glycosylase